MSLILKVVIEIPKNSKIKYEFDRKTNEISVDRILYGPAGYPENYGFIKNALDWDGDELDVLVMADQEFIPGIVVPTRIIGAMEMIDGGETDTKLIGVIDVDPRYNHIKTINDVPSHSLLVIKDFFETYKNLQKKKVIIRGFRDLDWAISEYEQCCQLMNKYGTLSKEEFLIKMKKENPDKYIK